MVIGILGGGQLARMMALAAYPLGLQTHCFDPTANVCAADVTSVTTADYTDDAAIMNFCQQVDMVTVENENIPIDCLQKIANIKPVHPNLLALTNAQDRYLEKTLFQQLDIATVAFQLVDSIETLQQACQTLGLPAVLKTRRLGYDGKGQFVIKTDEDIPLAWQQLQSSSLILERFCPFDIEVSIIAVRGHDQSIRFYPLSQNQHQQGILRFSIAPFNDDSLTRLARQYAESILCHTDYIGVFTMEFFVQQGQLFANEIAPRVHNSGHWTIEGAVTSQFENHIRAVAGLPLGSTAAIGYSAMMNCIGHMPKLHTALSDTHLHYHSYNKTAKPARKLGHLTWQRCTEPFQVTEIKQIIKKIS